MQRAPNLEHPVQRRSLHVKSVMKVFWQSWREETSLSVHDAVDGHGEPEAAVVRSCTRCCFWKMSVYFATKMLHLFSHNRWFCAESTRLTTRKGRVRRDQKVHSGTQKKFLQWVWLTMGEWDFSSIHTQPQLQWEIPVCTKFVFHQYPALYESASNIFWLPRKGPFLCTLNPTFRGWEWGEEGFCFQSRLLWCMSLIHDVQLADCFSKVYPAWSGSRLAVQWNQRQKKKLHPLHVWVG